MTNVNRAEDARETIQKKRKYENTDTEDKETERLKERKVQKVDTKEQKLEKIKAVLKDLSSQIGENLSVTLEKGATETQEEQEIELHMSEGEVITMERKDQVDRKSKSSSSSSSSSSSFSCSSDCCVAKAEISKKGEMSKTEERSEKDINASASSSDVRYVISEIDVHLQYLQECQENIVVLNVGGSKNETSKTTLRADPSSIFALMLQPNSAFRPCNNIFSFDRDSTHFKIILNY